MNHKQTIFNKSLPTTVTKNNNNNNRKRLIENSDSQNMFKKQYQTSRSDSQHKFDEAPGTSRSSFLPMPSSYIPSQVVSSKKETDDSVYNARKKLKIITGTVDEILEIWKNRDEKMALFEIFGKVINIKSGKYQCEQIYLLRNNTGPVMEAVYYCEINFKLDQININDYVRCVGRCLNQSRLQILKISLTNHNEIENLSIRRLSTLSNFILNKDN